MDTKNSINSSESPESEQSTEQPIQNETQQRSLVPKGITIGLAVFALVLSLAGYGFRLMVGDDTGEVLRHAAVIVPAFMLGIPLFFG